jgi:DNA-binding response OmpR family regulator
MKRILLLENDDSLLYVLREALSFEGYDVKCLGQTKDIFPEIEDFRPDVVILDYLLNGTNGGEICHQIKVNDKTSAIPVILVSAYPKVFKYLGYYGSDDFIPKPFDLEDFTSRIKKLAYRPINKQLRVV